MYLDCLLRWPYLPNARCLRLPSFFNVPARLVSVAVPAGSLGMTKPLTPEEKARRARWRELRKMSPGQRAHAMRGSRPRTAREILNTPVTR